VQHYVGDQGIYVLPLGIDDVPPNQEAFDTVFSMGVLYHRRSPIDHLMQLRDCLKQGGELVLETLIVEGDESTALLPEDRYARMGNVWFLPSVPMLERWLRRCRFDKIRTVDVTQTSIDEQRATEWMTFQSLADFLDPEDKNKSIEGYPAPRRAILIAEKI
jgi:tRNA (mo5U34)-methyltransferase